MKKIFFILCGFVIGLTIFFPKEVLWEKIITFSCNKIEGVICENIEVEKATFFDFTLSELKGECHGLDFGIKDVRGKVGISPLLYIFSNNSFLKLKKDMSLEFHLGKDVLLN